MQICFRAGITADSCNGDSGGPLFLPATDTMPTTLVGLVSHGQLCDDVLAAAGASLPVRFYTGACCCRRGRLGASLQPALDWLAAGGLGTHMCHSQ